MVGSASSGEVSLVGGRSGARRVLILARSSTVPGGVVVFLETAVRHLSSDWKAQWFPIGRRETARNPLGVVLQPLIDAWRLYRKLQHHRYDLVQVNPSLGTRSILRDGLFLFVVRGCSRHRCLVFFHGWDDRLAQWITKLPPLRWLFRRTFGAAEQIIVLAPQFRKRLLAMGIRDESVSMMTTMFDGALFREATPIHRPDSRQILFLSRLENSKGLNVLVEAFWQVCQTLPEVKLVLAGEGTLRKRFASEQSSRTHGGRITCPGYVTGAAKVRLLETSTVFVLPSHSEACPVAILEAMAAGLPIVASRVGAIPLLVKDGENGVLLHRLARDCLVDALLRLLTDGPLRARMAATNRIVAWERFEAQKVTATLEGYYRRVALRDPPVGAKSSDSTDRPSI